MNKLPENELQKRKNLNLFIFLNDEILRKKFYYNCLYSSLLQTLRIAKNKFIFPHKSSFNSFCEEFKIIWQKTEDITTIKAFFMSPYNEKIFNKFIYGENEN